MQYQQYQPNWQGQFAAQQYPQTRPQMQPYQPYQQQGGQVKVDGPMEAMNRFIMMYPANALMPGFISDPLFDVNGRQFHTLSVEADGRRNLETFDFEKHVEARQAQGTQYATREELRQLAAKLESFMEASNGIHAAVPTESVPASAYAGPDGIHDAGQDWHAQEPSGGQPAGRAGTACQV